MTDIRTLEDWLDDLCARFIINLPETDLSSVQRICFHVEEAQWFYEDFIRPLDPTLPSMTLRTFCMKIFAHCPLLSVFSHENRITAFEEFMKYKSRIPVRGAILLNAAMDSVILVKGWKKGAGWSFPRGKINHEEDDLVCAIREVYEETGYHIQEASVDRQNDQIQKNLKEQHVMFFLIRGVPMDTHFETQTRQEIGKIQWWPLHKLPGWRGSPQHHNQADVAVNANKFYMVAPFLRPLREWIKRQRQKDAKQSTDHYMSNGPAVEDLLTEDDQVTDTNASGPAYGQVPKTTTTFEGTNAALTRLVKSQAPTQGLQAEGMKATQASDSKPNPQDLLALLRGNNSAPVNAPPHTPLDHVFTNAPVPQTPHHQQPRPQHFSSMPPPPNFPFYPTMHASVPFQGQVPQNFQQGFLGHQQMHHPGAIPQPVSHPLPRQQVQRPQKAHSYQPQLVHPQPLPPNVQKAVFSGLVHTPSLPQSSQPQASSYQSNPNSNFAAQNPQFPGLHAPMVPPMVKQSSKLTSHSLALLNAFKRQDSAASNTSNLASRSSTQIGTHAIDIQPQELYGETASLPQATVSQTIKSGTTIANPAANTTPVPNLLDMFKDPGSAVSDSGAGATQKSALLSLFKSPATQPAVTSSVPAAHESHRSALLGLLNNSNPTVHQSQTLNRPLPTSSSARPPHMAPSAVELSAVEPLAKASTHSVGSDKAALHNELPAVVPEMNPETNLPFRATAILARPSQSQNSPNVNRAEREPTTPRASERVRPGKQPIGVHGSNKKTNASKKPRPQKSPERPFQPQILKRPQPEATAVSETSISPAPVLATVPVSPPVMSQGSDHKQALLSMFGQSAMTSPPLNSASIPYRPSSNQNSVPGEQSQKLLSLFAKQPAATNPLLKAQGNEETTSTHSVDTAFDPASRSRVGSLASGAASSRRGSQTPISPADKGFLLNYLDNVAKGSFR
ncbi:hypothetical protein BP5796_00450 [Coleophoma crateriformis]|uniref:Nudix hydrolase domain-containing protein n=1 Tax=Coleophoma crateriformis TaxID=565419 RepID=A0A3D8T7Z6_9HELO|nr:hypothetical protein BP5796_00450 [Coleophoma crateriformis]